MCSQALLEKIGVATTNVVVQGQQLSAARIIFGMNLQERLITIIRD